MKYYLTSLIFVIFLNSCSSDHAELIHNPIKGFEKEYTVYGYAVNDTLKQKVKIGILENNMEGILGYFEILEVNKKDLQEEVKKEGNLFTFMINEKGENLLPYDKQNESISDFLNQQDILIPFPNSKIEIGEEWKIEEEIRDFEFPLLTKKFNLLKNIGKELVISATYRYSGSSTKKDIVLMGEIVLDNKTGMLIQSDMIDSANNLRVIIK